MIEINNFASQLSLARKGLCCCHLPTFRLQLDVLGKRVAIGEKTHI